MLTRYRELYNKLTHSQAFKEDGQMDNSKINKGNFTPHNLKTIGFGVNGAICVYFTANNSAPRKIDIIRFNDLYTNDQEYLKALKEDKGMVDALVDGLKFNYIEEILLFAGDFTEEELQKEVYRLQRFIANSETAKTMKRLKGIVVVRDILNDGYLQLNPNKSIVDQLAKSNVSLEVLVEFKPERTSLGLLLNQGLDTVMYPQDEKLVKYFENEQKKAEQVLKDKEAEDKKAAKQLDQEELNSYIDDLWVEVQPIYTELYKNSVEQGCVGILVPTGFVGYKDNKLYTNNSLWIQNIYKSMEQANKFKFLNTGEVESLTFQDLQKYNYFSKYHALNVFGVIRDGERTRRWDTLLPVIEKRFKQLATVYLSKVETEKIVDVYGELKEKLTNCVVVERYDRQKIISLKYKLGDMKLEYNTFFERNSKEITKTETCKIINSDISQNNVVTLFGVFDAKKFASEALFSYQAYDNHVKNGGKVGLDRIIVGRRLNGTNQTFSLKSNDTRVTAIFAGSGSGKGVMTLGLLSAIVANNAPFIYLDYKPDMAEMLWEIEKGLAADGVTRSDGKPCRILAIDAKADATTCNPPRPHRFAENLPQYLSDIPNTVFAVLPYLKLLQLYYILGSLRANEENKPEYGGAMTFAILDEFQANMKDNLSKLITTLDSEFMIAKKSKDETFKDIEKYVLKLKTLVARLANETGTFINTDGRKSQCRAIYLGQNADYNVWNSDKVEVVKNLASEWYLKTSYRFFGRNGGTGSYAPTNAGAISEFVNNENTFGYWTSVVGSGSVKEIKNWDVFKAYSVLNENDFNIENPMESGRCTLGVLNNIQVDDVKTDLIENVFVMNDNQGNSVLRPEVGFLGLVRKLSGFSDCELADALSAGYELMWKVMCNYNMDSIYPDIETYLFDASLESIYTTDEIRQGVQQKVETSVISDNSKVFEDESDLYLSYEDNEDVINSQVTQQPIKTSERPTRVNTPQVPESKITNTPFQNTNQGNMRPQRLTRVSKPTNTYNGFLQVKENPFELYKGDSVQSTLLSMREITKIIMEDIKKNIGDSSLIKEFKVTQDGILVFDNIAYQPQFDDNFLESLPMTLKEQVVSGQLIEMFDLGRLYDFNNLTTFIIEDEGLAQGRARKEMGIGFRKRYSVLFKKFKYLNYIKVGHIEYSRENPDTKVEQGFLEKFKIDPASTFSPNSNSRMDKVWDSKPVRVLTNAFGWTMGVQAVWMATALFGPIGLLFGGLALSGAVLEARKEFKDTPTGNKDKGSQNKNNKW